MQDQKLTALADISGKLATQMQVLTPEIMPQTIFYRMGGLADAIVVADSQFESHPASTIAINLLKRIKHTERTAFQGIAVSVQEKLFGLLRNTQAISLLTCNVDQYNNEGAAVRDLCHFFWHSLDMALQIQQPENAQSVRNGPLVPKRSPLSLTRANLKADIFASLLAEAFGYEGSIAALGHERALDALLPRVHHRPWQFPFPIAKEMTEYSWNNLFSLALGRYSNHVGAAYQLAADISAQLDEFALRRWWAFVEPAQEMAWRGEKPDNILGLAMAGSDPLLKSTALIISDTSSLEAAAAESLNLEQYNAFIDNYTNRQKHERAVEETFEIVMAQGLSEESSQPFYRAANDQNVQMADGKMFGWCAYALQAAAKAFDMAQASGRSPELMAKIEFQGNTAVDFDKLKKLSDKIVDSRRTGFMVSLQDIVQMTDNEEDFKPVAASMQRTLENADYQARYAPRPDVSIPQVTPNIGPAPQPQMAPQVAPQMVANLGPTAMPGMSPMGGGMMSGGVRHVQQTAAPPPKEDQTTES